jgi:transposase InsO family protein
VNLENRKQILQMVKTAVGSGCNQQKACEAVDITPRTYQRWGLNPGLGDGRFGPLQAPGNRLTEFEQAKVIKIATSTEFCDKSPHQIVPTLADRGEYVASESSFYRFLKAAALLNHRGKSKPRSVTRPKAYVAVRPNQIYSWDITYLLSAIRGLYYYLYLFLDIFSRKIVGWEVHERESAELSSRLLVQICKNEGVKPDEVTLHSDNGGPMKGATMLVTMQKLGVMPSFSRPSVSNDNPYSEAMFKTLKYCPQFPTKPFETIEAARDWVKAFVIWYNTEQLHSGINFVTPASKHNGNDVQILEKRGKVYAEAKEKNPARWSGKTRNWQPVREVKLNWLKDDQINFNKELTQMAC